MLPLLLMKSISLKLNLFKYTKFTITSNLISSHVTSQELKYSISVCTAYIQQIGGSLKKCFCWYQTQSITYIQ